MLSEARAPARRKESDALTPSGPLHCAVRAAGQGLVYAHSDIRHDQMGTILPRSVTSSFDSGQRPPRDVLLGQAVERNGCGRRAEH